MTISCCLHIEEPTEELFIPVI